MFWEQACSFGDTPGVYLCWILKIRLAKTCNKLELWRCLETPEKWRLVKNAQWRGLHGSRPRNFGSILADFSKIWSRSIKDMWCFLCFIWRPARAPDDWKGFIELGELRSWVLLPRCTLVVHSSHLSEEDLSGSTRSGLAGLDGLAGSMKHPWFTTFKMIVDHQKCILQ